MEVGNCIVCGCELGENNHFMSACALPVSPFVGQLGHTRCTAVLVGSMMILSLYVPHGGYDEEDYITEVEVVKIIMEEEMGAKDCFIGGDINVELKLEGAVRILRFVTELIGMAFT